MTTSIQTISFEIFGIVDITNIDSPQNETLDLIDLLDYSVVVAAHLQQPG